MDPMKIIESLGGGLSATVIVVEFLIICYLFRRLDQAQEDRLKDMVVVSKDQRELHVSSMRTVDSVVVAMEAFVDAAKANTRRPRDDH